MASGIAIARGQRIDGVVARDAGQVEGLGRACRRLAARTGEETRPVILRQQREDEIAPRVHVVHGDEQLAESRLPEVLRDELDVAAPELGRRWRRQRRGAANQVPELRAAARRRASPATADRR